MDASEWDKLVAAVAPPRGERGLKSMCAHQIGDGCRVAPPRGERGLKYAKLLKKKPAYKSLPLVGSVD